ncbi:hypothetical protein F383_06569 [Gossypium arboreum]|nr:hypothetical protein F383_19327 [Gossypium arboreum]KHG18109.1 hypothetical protein F383_06569 [Gossypium arboreum]
MKILVN